MIGVVEAHRPARVPVVHGHGSAAGGVARRGRSSQAGDGYASRGSAELRLEQADAEVRAHEAAHLAAAGAVASGGPSYTYAIGPGGKLYAVGGSVRVDTTPVPGDPEATIRKAKALIQAAYAVGQPSAADMRIAAEAYQMEMAAKAEYDKAQARPKSDSLLPLDA